MNEFHYTKARSHKIIANSQHCNETKQFRDPNINEVYFNNLLYLTEGFIVTSFGKDYSEILGGLDLKNELETLIIKPLREISNASKNTFYENHFMI